MPVVVARKGDGTAANAKSPHRMRRRNDDEEGEARLGPEGGRLPRWDCCRCWPSWGWCVARKTMALSLVVRTLFLNSWVANVDRNNLTSRFLSGPADALGE